MIALLLAAAQIGNVSASRDDSVLTVRVEADAALDATKVAAKLESRRLLLEVPAALDKESRTFHVSHRYLQAKRVGENVEVEIPIGAKVNCSLPVTVSAVTNGIEAKLKCEDEKEEAVAPTPAPAPVAVEAAKPAPIVAQAPVVVPTPVPTPVPAPVLQKSEAEPQHSTSPFGAIAIVIIFAGLACAALFARKKKQSSKTIQVIETAALGPKRSLVVAKVGGRTLLLSSSEAGVTLLQNLDGEVAAQPQADAFQKLDEHMEERPKLDVMAKLRKFAVPQRKAQAQPSFDALFAEEQEDQELRMKLLAGQSTRAQ